MYHFHSSIEERGNFKSNFPEYIIKNETMLFNCDLEFAYANGGELTQSFIDTLPDDWKDCNPVVDSRVHMLMDGWFPCIPGYHHDDVPRNTPTGQPNYDHLKYHSQHLMGLLNGDICSTLFALGKHSLPVVDGVIYQKWHPMVEQQIKDGLLITYPVKSGVYTEFDWQSMHTGQRAVKSGWRWFIRLSRQTDRQKLISNEIRKQSQVYLEFPMQGW